MLPGNRDELELRLACFTASRRRAFAKDRCCRHQAAAHLRDGGTTSRSLARSRLSRAVAGLADLIDQPAAQVPDVVTVG